MNFEKIQKVLEFPGLAKDGETSISEKAGGRSKWYTFLEHKLTIYTNILISFALGQTSSKFSKGNYRYLKLQCTMRFIFMFFIRHKEHIILMSQK